MASDDDSSDLSSLSSLSPVPSDDELDGGGDNGAAKKGGILKFFSKVSEQPPRSPTPPPRKRSPSPPHEYVLADNPDIAVCSYAVTAAGACLRPRHATRERAGELWWRELCADESSLLSCLEADLPMHYRSPLPTLARRSWSAMWSSRSRETAWSTFFARYLGYC